MIGYFGVAVWQPRHEANIGTLWRSAKTYQAAFLATVGSRYSSQASDTCKTPQSVPLHHYSNINDLVDHLPHGCPLVGVELDDQAVPLHQFEHPLRAVYLLGAEDHGLPATVLARCHHIVQVLTPEPWSLNVSVAGSLVLDHRWNTKRRVA
jgi:tRNA G18 (ribose-2'-O)-methylase SpoU